MGLLNMTLGYQSPNEVRNMYYNVNSGTPTTSLHTHCLVPLAFIREGDKTFLRKEAALITSWHKLLSGLAPRAALSQKTMSSRLHKSFKSSVGPVPS